jgi:hypothetical protein
MDLLLQDILVTSDFYCSRDAQLEERNKKTKLNI